MNLAVKELQEVNKDVLLGKKSANCLSCGKDDAITHMPLHGNDGQIYRAHKENTKRDMRTDASSKKLGHGSTTHSYVHLRPTKHQRV
jgi:hypothetical protein